MRASMMIVIAAAAALATACTEDIGSGSYYCGSNAICPDNQQCDGMTNTCVIPETVVPFMCAAPITTQTLTGLACVSPLQTTASCLGASTDRGDFEFVAPASCSQVVADARVAFPVAYAQVGLSIAADADGSVLATDTACTGATGAGEASRCVTAKLTPGSTYHLYVALDASGAGDCGGDCDFNRYSLSFQLDSD